MTDSEILARWQGYKQHPNGVSCYTGELRSIGGTLKWPDYLNDDSAAMSLLDTLVEKGYSYTLEESKDGVVFVVSKVKWSDTARLDFALTRREAIIAACLEVVRKEMV